MYEGYAYLLEKFKYPEVYHVESEVLCGLTRRLSPHSCFEVSLVCTHPPGSIYIGRRTVYLRQGFWLAPWNPSYAARGLENLWLKTRLCFGSKVFLVCLLLAVNSVWTGTLIRFFSASHVPGTGPGA